MMKKTIAIEGATTTNGKKLAQIFATGHTRLLLIGQDQHQLDILVKEILKTNPDAEIESQACVTDGCWEADIIILIHTADLTELIEKIKPVCIQKQVLYFNAEKKAVEELQKLLPYSKVAGLQLNQNKLEVIPDETGNLTPELNSLIKQNT